MNGENDLQEPRHGSVMCLRPEGFRRMHYVEWGDPDNPRVAVCVHGLTRNSRDFDWLARSLADSYRVICPDVLGRGLSDWLSDPKGYNYPSYLADMATLLARLDVEEVDWIGTSMGGLIGMMLAATDAAPVRRLVMNDVGPFLPRGGLERLLAAADEDPRFPTQEEAEAYLRKIYAPFGDLTDEQWRHLTVHSMRVTDEGLIAPVRDPGLLAPIRAQPLQDVDLWPIWDAVRCPVLVLRGEDSDLLLPETVAEMRRRHSGCEVEEFEGVGHAPALMDAEQVFAVQHWLAVQAEA